MRKAYRRDDRWQCAIIGRQGHGQIFKQLPLRPDNSDSSRMTTLALNPQASTASKPLSNGRLLRWIIAAAMLSGLCYLLTPAHQFEDGFSEEDHIARHLARGDGFLSPFDDRPQAPPTSWCPPVYPFVMSLAYRLFDQRTQAVLSAIVLFNIFCRTACAAALFALGTQFSNHNVGLLAAGLFLVHPMFLHVVDSLWDNYLALAMFLWLLWWTVQLSRADRVRKSQMAAMGAALGLLLLTNTSYALACPAMVLLALAKQNWRRRALLMTVATVAAVIVLLPWTLRNYRTFDRLFLVRGNANVELWLANQPCSYGWMSLAVLDSHPSRNAAEHRLVLEEGETKYFALCGKRFAYEYRSAPGHFWFVCGERFVHAFIFDTGRTGAYLWRDIDIDRYLINAFVVIFGLAGAWTAWRLKHKGVALLGIALLAIVPYLVTQVYNRYAMPLRAILLVFAAYLIVTMAPKRKSNCCYLPPGGDCCG
jgi:4-amino-4-deoxy-L-arabinose transferase-like glycosyltransferase